MARVFRYKKALGLDYNTQGYIYFLSKRYKGLSLEERKKVQRVCAEAGGESRRALFEYVTTNIDEDTICARHYISGSTLSRMVRRYYRIFADEI